jgi:hypothetical protein
MSPDTLPSETTAESLYIASFTANTDLTGVDVKDYIGKVKVILNAAAATNDNQPANVSIQTSDESNANFAAFSTAVAFTAIAVNGAATTESIEFDTRLAKRYVRAHVVESAAGNSRDISVVLVGKKQITA